MRSYELSTQSAASTSAEITKGRQDREAFEDTAVAMVYIGREFPEILREIAIDPEECKDIEEVRRNVKR